MSSFGKKHFLQFDVEYQGLKITSPVALQNYTADSKFDWLVPFRKGDDPTEWTERLEESAAKALGGLTPRMCLLSKPLLKAEPYLVD